MVSRFGKKLKGKIIVVYGASSSIGRKFIIEAAKKGLIVIAFARNINKITSSKNIQLIKGDITLKKDISKSLQGRKVYATINFAVDFSPDYLKARRVNVLGEQYIIDASKKYGVKRHIYISTAATQMVKPNTYRDTKLEAENLVRETCKKYNIDWVILRFANVLGTPTWDQPFKIIFPFIRLGVPKVPTDFPNSPFFYLTINTAIEATLSAIISKPNQTITVFDGTISIGQYLSVMERIFQIKKSFLSSRLLTTLDKLFGKYLPQISGYSSALEFLANPPKFENNTMKNELKLKTKPFPNSLKVRSK